jgi:hydroxymethylpyrimidine/phosphomethylpyrimidine kinase
MEDIAVKTVLTIAGSDCSGGAGIQADIKTMTAHKVYAMSAITALTAQNTTGVYGVQEVTPDFLKEQLDCIFTDIMPDAVKIGMVSSAALINVIVDALQRYHARHIVLDPVMVATSGSRLMADGAASALQSRLFPLAEVVTPNIPEAEALSGMTIHTKEEMRQAARIIAEHTGGAVLVKGGHLTDTADDLLLQGEDSLWLTGERVDTHNTHGTGCTLSSAIASNLALGYSLADSVARAKAYITAALKAGLDLGRGNGPLDHMALLSD